MDHELNKQIAMARLEFNVVKKLCSHSSLTWPRKLAMFSSLIESKLLYSLAGACLSKVQLRRLDAFQNRCLGYIIGIKPSFLSRISKADVLARANHVSASKLLLRKQLILFGKVLRSAPEHPLRYASFIPGTTAPLTERYVRRVGRPAKEFVPDMLRQSCAIFGSIEATLAAAENKIAWKLAVCAS